MTDAIDLTAAVVVNAPADVADWPITVVITELRMNSAGPKDGVGFTTAPELPASWNCRPAGWTGDLQYTVWPVVKVNGQWVTSGIIQMWQGRPNTGAPILTDFHKNWAYATRWGGLYDYQPQVGDRMGFFLTAGNARDERGVTSVRERSNVVVVNLPAHDDGVFTFAPDVVVQPPPPAPPPPAPPVSVEVIGRDEFDGLLRRVEDVETDLRDGLAQLKRELLAALDARAGASPGEVVVDGTTGRTFGHTHTIHLTAKAKP